MTDVTRAFATSAEVVHRATFELVWPRERNERVRAFREHLEETIRALRAIAALRFELALDFHSTAEADAASLKAWEASRVTLREGMAAIERDDEVLFRMAVLAPDLRAPLRAALDAALANVIDLRIGVALVLEDSRELDELGYVSPPQAPIGTRGPCVPLEDVLRELA